LRLGKANAKPQAALSPRNSPMNRNDLWTRRSVLRLAGAGAVGVLAAPHIAAKDEAAKGNVKQSICRWCYGKIPLEKLAEEAKKIGYQSIELLLPDEYLKIKPFGLTCAMIGGADIANGLNRKKNH